MNIRLLATLIILTVLRLVYIGQVGLSPDEAYYHEWSQRLDWCYFSKGPGVALTIRAGTELFGHTVFGIRFFAPMLALGTSVLMWWLARRIYDDRVAFWTVIVMNCTPIFNVGGLVMSIDPLSIFFWTATLCTLWLALERSPAFSWWWPLSGLLVGLGFLCKWTNAFLLLGLLLLLIFTPRYRRELRGAGFWSLIAAFLPALWPVYYWQDPRGWPILNHLSARGGLEAPWYHLEIANFFKFIASHFGAYSPLIFAGMLIALWMAVGESFSRWAVGLWRALKPAVFVKGLKRHAVAVSVFVFLALALFFAGNFFEIKSLHKAALLVVVTGLVAAIARCKEPTNIHWKSRFLSAFALPVILTYIWIALHHDAEVNWTAPAAVTVVILAVAHWVGHVSARLTKIALGLGIACSLMFVATDLVRAVGIPWPLSKDPSSRLRGWAETARVVDDYRKQVEAQIGRPVFLIAENYGVAGALCFHLPKRDDIPPGHPAVYVEGSPVPGNQFHFWGRYDEIKPRTTPVLNDQDDSKEYGISEFEGRTALYITTREREKEPPSVVVDSFFDAKDPAKPWKKYVEFELKEHGQPLRIVRIFICPRFNSRKVLD